MKSNSQLFLSIILISTALVGAFAVVGILTTSRTIGSRGTVKSINVEVYWDSSCTNVVNEIDWGTLDPGVSATRTIHVKNTGNAELTLHMHYSDWVPSEAGDYITLSWNKEGGTVGPDAVVEAVLTLSVSDSTSGITTFSFNIIIEGIG